MKTLLIVYHSQSGASFDLARAARQGALQEQVEVNWRRAWDAGLADLAACDGLLLVAPENSGSLTGAMKDFLDRTFYPAQEQPLLLPYMLVVSAGNDGRGAIAQAQRILSGYPMKPVAEPLICRGEVTTDHRRQCAEAGQALAAGLTIGIY